MAKCNGSISWTTPLLWCLEFDSSPVMDQRPGQHHGEAGVIAQSSMVPHTAILNGCSTPESRNGLGQHTLRNTSSELEPKLETFTSQATQ